MGFRLSRVYALRFSGALEGLEVDIKGTSVGVVQQLRETETRDVQGLAKLLAAHIIRWNYENEDGTALEATPENLVSSLEEPVLGAIVKEWYRAATGVTAPLDERSTSGSQFPEASIPMEVDG